MHAHGSQCKRREEVWLHLTFHTKLFHGLEICLKLCLKFVILGVPLFQQQICKESQTNLNFHERVCNQSKMTMFLMANTFGFWNCSSWLPWGQTTQRNLNYEFGLPSLSCLCFSFKPSLFFLNLLPNIDHIRNKDNQTLVKSSQGMGVDFYIASLIALNWILVWMVLWTLKVPWTWMTFTT